jgi:hypothetical protein
MMRFKLVGVGQPTVVTELNGEPVLVTSKSKL